MKLIGEKLVLVEVPEYKKKTEGGIYLPENVIERETNGSMVYVVLDMSDDVKEEGSLNVGDRVLGPRYFGTRVYIKDPRHLRLIVRRNILAVLEDHEEAD